MNTAHRTRIAWWVAVALAVCAALALRDVAASIVQPAAEDAAHAGKYAPASGLFYLASTDEQAAWVIAYYLMWAALTPLIFAAARRVRFRRNRWLPPLALHLLASVIVSASAPVALGILFGSLVRGYPLPDPLELLTPFWTQLAAYRAVADTSVYWMILIAGFALSAYDEDQGRQRQAADLQRALVVAQVDALKMKLQPHFLFNTLNSISFLAVERDVTGVVTMVERLSALLRSSMQATGSQLVTVEAEVALLDQYLAIEETRFADRLRVVRSIDPAVTHALLPSLVLQPIIENSIKHGFSRRIDASRVEITVRRQGDALVVAVRDDGPGLPPGWDLATHCGRGLKNVIERLDKLYPGAWAFTLTEAPGGGALAEVRIPFQEQPGRCVLAGSNH